jgi:hypothetical protein
MIREAVGGVGSTSVVDLIGELERGKAVAMRRLQEPGPQRLTLWSAEEIAGRFSVSTKWVYKHAQVLGAHRLSSNVLRFDPAKVEAYIRSSRE